MWEITVDVILYCVRFLFDACVIYLGKKAMDYSTPVCLAASFASACKVLNKMDCHS